MEERARKPIATTFALFVIFFIAGSVLFYFGETISGVLSFILAGMIGCIRLLFWITILLLQQPGANKKSRISTKNIAKLYLKDRRLSYNRSTFEKAITYQWLDIITMCFELGIKDNLNQETRSKIIDQVINADNDKILQLLEHANFLSGEKMPLIHALKQGSLKCFKLLLKMSESGQEDHQIKFKRLEMPLSLEKPDREMDDIQLLINIIKGCDEETLELLKDYFNHQEEYSFEIQEEMTGYVRLSVVEAAMEKYRIKTSSFPVIKKEDECKKDLYRYISKNYVFTMPEQFMIEGIYKERPYLGSQKVPCEHCDGEGHIVCVKCEGKRYIVCPNCIGEGKVTCRKCGGAQRLMCWDVKKYIECQSCYKGEFLCHKCDENGLAVCPTCDGKGTRKCSCPKSQKTKCLYCHNGYVPLKNGVYKKCEHCEDGYICGLCHNTGWVIDHQGKKELMCSKCNGNKKITCPTCKGNKKLRCSKAHEIVCECHEGMEDCSECQGRKVILCDSCQGTGKNKCSHCEDGYVFENTQVDFKGKQIVLNEVILTSKYSDKIDAILSELSQDVVNNHSFIQEVYTLQKARMTTRDIQISEFNYEEQIKKMVAKYPHDEALTILEVIPLKLTIVTCKSYKGKSFECVLINDKFYRTIQI